MSCHLRARIYFAALHWVTLSIALAACDEKLTPATPVSEAVPDSVSAEGGVIADADSASTASAPMAGDATVQTSAEGPALPCAIDRLLSRHCRACHAEMPVHGAPMALTSIAALRRPSPTALDKPVYRSVLERVEDEAHPMPPAPYPRLVAGEVQALRAWVESGANAASERCEPAPAAAESDASVAAPEDCEATHELRASSVQGAAASAGFEIPAVRGEPDQYRCFYFAPPYASDAALYGYEPLIDNKARLHHWVLYGTENATHAPGSNAPCLGGEAGAYTLVGWAPGANNVSVPKDVGLRLPSGPRAGLILQFHYYNDSEQGQQDASGVRLCTGSKHKRAHLAGVHMLDNQGICIPPNSKGEARSTCTPRTDLGDAHITGVWPHMHKLGRRMRVTLKRANGTTELIHDAPFDFGTQIFYPKDEVVLRAGDSLETQCSFDNPTNAQVGFGERTGNEMCVAFVTAWPAGVLADSASVLGSSLGIDLADRCTDRLASFFGCGAL